MIIDRAKYMYKNKKSKMQNINWVFIIIGAKRFVKPK